MAWRNAEWDYWINLLGWFVVCVAVFYLMFEEYGERFGWAITLLIGMIIVKE